MLISDLSSDVCSSDLPRYHIRRKPISKCLRQNDRMQENSGLCYVRLLQLFIGTAKHHVRNTEAQDFVGLFKQEFGFIAMTIEVFAHPRSEEHTSELQSLMRISYAVFCLKKKMKITKQ